MLHFLGFIALVYIAWKMSKWEREADEEKAADKAARKEQLDKIVKYLEEIKDKR